MIVGYSHSNEVEVISQKEADWEQIIAGCHHNSCGQTRFISEDAY